MDEDEEEDEDEEDEDDDDEINAQNSKAKIQSERDLESIKGSTNPSDTSAFILSIPFTRPFSLFLSPFFSLPCAFRLVFLSR